MDLLTYIFKGSYVNRKKDKYFIKNILSTFNRDEITGVGIKVNNNPWSFEVFIFIQHHRRVSNLQRRDVMVITHIVQYNRYKLS